MPKRPDEFTDEYVLDIAVADLQDWGGHEKQVSAEFQNINLSVLRDTSDDGTIVFCIDGTAKVTYSRDEYTLIDSETDTYEHKQWYETELENYEWEYHINENGKLVYGSPD